MNGHESIRAKLAIAASGALDQEERLLVEQHTRECQNCRRELELWTLYARELRHLPHALGFAGAWSMPTCCRSPSR